MKGWRVRVQVILGLSWLKSVNEDKLTSNIGQHSHCSLSRDRATNQVELPLSGSGKARHGGRPKGSAIPAVPYLPK